MNVVRFNDPFEAAVRNAIGDLQWDKLAISPLFDYGLHLDGLSEKLEHAKDVVTNEDGAVYFPFDRMRIEMRAIGTLEDLRKTGMIISANNFSNWLRYQAMILSGGVIFFRITHLTPQYRRLEEIIFRISLKRILLPGGAEAVDASVDNDELEMEWFKNGQWGAINPAHEVAKDRSVRDIRYTVMAAIASFAADAMSPATHRVSVHPAGEGRSVEWVKARTHYTLISHGHPANKASVKHGDSIAGDRNGELTRMAHNRRAHFRVMQHERYRFTRGKKIFVRAAWIGPKEWKGEGGRQVYRILEPVE